MGSRGTSTMTQEKTTNDQECEESPQPYAKEEPRARSSCPPGRGTPALPNPQTVRAPLGRDRAAPRPSRRVLAAWAGLCAAGLALALAGAAPAQAQSNTTTRIWSADMTVGNFASFDGYLENSTGSLSDTTFTFKGVVHTIEELLEQGEKIFFHIDPGFGSQNDFSDVSDYIEDLRLSFTQGDTSYAFDFSDRESNIGNLHHHTTSVWADTTRTWSSGDDIEVRLTTRAPSEPTDVRAQAGARSVSLTWDVPDTNGGGISAQRGIYRYELRYKVGSGSYGDWQTVPGGGSARSHTLTDLEGGVGHAFQLRARNDYGSNMYSDAVLATPLKVPEIAGVSMVSSPLQGDTYGRGETIEFEVAFDEPVVISGGSLHASLFVGAGSGGTERRADYVPATDTNAPRTLRFLYTVQESDADSDGATVGANALAVGGAPDGSPKGGGTIKSNVEIGTGLDADLSSDSMSFPNHKVDGSVLLVEPPGVTKIAISSAPANGAFFTDGEEILIDVDFADTVTVSGDEVSLALNIGGGSQTASFVQVVEITSAQVNIHRLVFAYIVQPGDVDSNGIRVPANALAVSGTTAVRDRYDRDAVLTHAAFEFTNYLVNPPPPGITDIEVSSPVPDAGFHSSALNDPVEFRVTFSDAVTVTGQEALFTVRVGGDDVDAAYSQGSGTTQLMFTLIYGAQHTDADGVSVPAGSLTLIGGTTLRDAYGRDVTLTHGAYAFPQHLINTPPPPPQITDIRIVSDVPDAGFYGPGTGGRSIEFEVTFSAPVTYAATSGDFGLKVLVGDAEQIASPILGFGTNKLIFLYTVVASDEDTDGVSIPAGSLVLTGDGTLKGPFGQDAALTHGAYAFPQHLVNTRPPPAHLTGIEVDSSPGSGGFYATGDTIELHVTFSGAVTAGGSASGTPPDVALKLRVGSAGRSAEYLLGSGTSKLRFLYTVQAGDEDRDGVSVPANALSLGTGMTLKDQFGQDVVSTHGARGFPDHLVNSAPPPRGITGIDVVSPLPDAGFYATGDTIELHVTFNGAVTAAGNAPGTPPGVALALRVGSADKSAGYLLGSGTSKLRFLYTVQAGDEDRDGVGGPANALSLGTGMTLKGPYGQDADLTHGAYGPFRHARVNFEAAPPSAPRNLAVTADNENEVRFRWDPPADDGGSPVTHYAYRYDANEDGVFTGWAYVGSTPRGQPPRRSWGIDVDADGDRVCVQVMAVNVANFQYVPELRNLEGEPTQAKCAVPYGPAEGAPEAPGWLRVTSTQADRADLEWDEPDESGNSPLWGYRIEVSTNGGGRWDELVANTGTPSLSRSDAGVDDLANRLYRVSAINTEERVGNPSPSARLAPMTLKQHLRPKAYQQFENAGDLNASSHSVTVAVELANPAPGRRVHVHIVTQGELVATRVHEPEGTGFTATFGGPEEDGYALEPQTYYTVQADVEAGFDSDRRVEGSTFTLPDIRQGEGPGRGVEVDTNGDGVAEDDPRLTVAMGAAAGIRVRPGACTGAKQVGVHGSLTQFGVHGFGPISAEASPEGHTWTCADGDDPGEWRPIELTLEKHADAMLAAPFEVGVRHNVYTQRPGRQSWEPLVLGGSFVRLEVVASETLAPVTGLAVEADGSDRPRVSWDAVAGAAAYQVQWRWGSEAYGRVHTENGAMSSREKRVTGTSHTVAVPSEAKRAEGLTVRVRAYDGDALTVGPWREAALGAQPGQPSGLTATPESGTAIGLAWEAPAANGARILGYGIEVSEDGARSWETLVEDTGSTARAYVHRSLAPGSQRFYRVRARNGAGWGARSRFAGTSTLRSGQASGALTARMGGLPERHDGSGSIGFKMTFSEPVTAGEDAVREHALSVTNGTVSEASQRDDEPGAYEMKVMPDSDRDVTIELRGGRPCAETGAICTEDGRRLAHALSISVPGPGTTSGPTVLTRFVLVDATAHADVGALADGARLTELDAATDYGFRAEVAATGGVASVTLVLAGSGLDDDVTQTENYAPWSLYGDTDGHEHGAALGDGAYTLTATAWSEDKGTGEALQTLGVSFTVGAAPAASLAGPPVVTGFELVDTASGGETVTLTDGETVTLAAPTAERYGLVATVASDDVKSVGLELRGSGLDDDVSQTENYAPWSLTGDTDGKAHGRALPVGSYTLVATAYAEKDLGGAGLGTLSVEFTVEAAQETAPPAAAALTASFVGMPAEHGGAGAAFTFRVQFSEDVKIGFAELRDDAFALLGVEVTVAKRVNGSDALREITVKPTGPYEIQIDLDGNRPCDVDGAICTAGGKMLSSMLSATVAGPPALRVADATVQEGPNATLDFVVTLDRAASGPVTVAYATADQSATAGQDYEATTGTLTFTPGETGKTVNVVVLDDAHDEGQETLTVVLSDASGATLADGDAIGTIRNSDPLQRAWLARFGRTVATHVTDAVGERFRAAPERESHLTVGGYRLPVATLFGGEAEATAPEASERESALLQGLAGLLGLGPPQREDPWTDPDGRALDPRLGQSRTLTLNLRQILQGSSFRLSLGRDEEGAAHPRLTAWGRVAGTRFDGRDGTLAVDGDVLTGTIGVDGEWDRLLAGVAVSHSRGDGAFAMPETAARGRGDLEQTQTSLHPYLRYAVNDRLAVWGVLGYGWGELTLTPDTGTTLATDTTLLMGAFGGRGILLAAADSGGFELATRTDAMLTRTTSDAVAGLESGDAEAHRLRLILEGSRGFTWAEGRSLTPSVELGLRHDWGDAETGFGVEIGGRMRYADPALGLTIEGAVRALLAHEDSDYEEWGASGSLRIDPGSAGQGLALTLAPAWGATASGVDGLWSQQTTAGLAPQGNRQAPTGQLNAEVGYGFAAFGTGLLTPYAGAVLSDGAARTYRVGTRLHLTGGWATGLTLNLEGLRQEPAGQQPVNQGLRLQLTWGF